MEIGKNCGPLPGLYCNIYRLYFGALSIVKSACHPASRRLLGYRLAHGAPQFGAQIETSRLAESLSGKFLQCISFGQGKVHKTFLYNARARRSSILFAFT